METEIQKIASLLKQTFEGGAWHGPAVRENLTNITEEQALRKLPNTHSIIELVSHMVTWRNYVIKKLAGDAEYKISDEMNFQDNKNWNECLQQLEDSQHQLLAAFEKFPAEKLSELVPGTKEPVTYYNLIHGIIHHDLYHTGQVGLIKKETRDIPVRPLRAV